MNIEVLECRIAPAALTITVTTLSDHGTGSLREALEDVNGSMTNDTIKFAPNLHGKILLQSPLPAISSNLTIENLGSKPITIDGANKFQIFNVESNGSANTVYLQYLTLTHGVAREGGAIHVDDSNTTVEVDNCVITANKAIGENLHDGSTLDGVGGGIAVDAGHLRVNASKISGNIAQGAVPTAGLVGGRGIGGGVFLYSGTTAGFYSNDKITGNKAIGMSGAAGANGADGTVGAGTQMGLSGKDGQRGENGGEARGGGIYSYGTLTIEDTTISGNMAVGGHGGRGGNGGNGQRAPAAQTLGGDGGNGGSGGNGGYANGGGVASVEGTMTISYSTVSGNVTISGLSGGGGKGGQAGAGTVGAGKLKTHAEPGSPGEAEAPSVSHGGGIFVFGSQFTLGDGTIAKNRANEGGGLYFANETGSRISNSTIAFNTSNTGASGVFTTDTTRDNLQIVSTIIAQNSASASVYDFAGDADLDGNLVQHFNPSDPLGFGTNITDTSALLGALGNHGGDTQTCVPSAKSKVIGQGGNPSNFVSDQRGHARESTGGTVDIGSVEVS